MGGSGRKTTHALCAGSFKRTRTPARADGERMTQGACRLRQRANARQAHTPNAPALATQAQVASHHTSYACLAVRTDIASRTERSSKAIADPSPTVAVTHSHQSRCIMPKSRCIMRTLLGRPSGPPAHYREPNQNRRHSLARSKCVAFTACALFALARRENVCEGSWIAKCSREGDGTIIEAMMGGIIGGFGVVCQVENLPYSRRTSKTGVAF